MSQHILLVEDEVDLRELYGQLLMLSGYDTHIVSDAETALTTLHNCSVDLVLTDWYLPGMMGDALLLDVQKSYPTIKTILMSSHADVYEAAKRCHASGGIQKGDLNRLRELIDAVLRPSVQAFC